MFAHDVIFNLNIGSVGKIVVVKVLDLTGLLPGHNGVCEAMENVDVVVADVLHWVYKPLTCEAVGEAENVSIRDVLDVADPSKCAHPRYLGEINPKISVF